MALDFVWDHLDLRISDPRRSLMVQYLFSGPPMCPLPRMNQAQPSPCQILSKRGIRQELITNAANYVLSRGRPRLGAGWRFRDESDTAQPLRAGTGRSEW